VALWPVPARVVHVSDTNIVVLAEPLPHGRLSRRELRCAEATGIVLQIELRPETATWTQIRTEVRGAAGCDASAEFGQRLHAIPLHFMSSVHEAALRASQGLGLPQ
jgi:hypothetical protein